MNNDGTTLNPLHRH